MKDEIAKRLLKLNQDFYARFAETFADSRSNPQPGFYRLLKYLPISCERVLDVGCGNGRFGQFLESEHLSFDYTGIDFTSELLVLAREQVQGDFFQRDISRRGFLEGIGKFDLIVCLATMQHVPRRSVRIGMLREMKLHLAKNGRIFLANWQFLDSRRQRRKICDWENANLSESDVEPGDYLLTWQRKGSGFRYVCAINSEETAYLASAAGMREIIQFRSDGREGFLNLYTVLTHDIQHNITDEMNILPVDRSDANATI
jgi:2-polyprenyl-3-methyl-5-hydroxy-6-metoxy-1,4-benzoquinol methylase